MTRRTFSLLALLATVAVAPGARGGTISVSFTEQGDAGGTPGTAQSVTGGGDDLFQISGNIDPLGDPVDLYRIRIVDPAAFSARTFNGDSEDPDTEFDATLALFDAAGFGVYSNDDRVTDDGNAELPAGNTFSPTQAGIYLLAIYDDNYAPLSELSALGLIFPPDDTFPFTDVVGPTGPGAGNPLLQFATLDTVPSDPRAYSIEFTGAAPLPEPGTAALLALGLGGLAALGRRRS